MKITALEMKARQKSDARYWEFRFEVCTALGTRHQLENILINRDLAETVSPDALVEAFFDKAKETLKRVIRENGAAQEVKP